MGNVSFRVVSDEDLIGQADVAQLLKFFEEDELRKARKVFLEMEDTTKGPVRAIATELVFMITLALRKKAREKK